MHTNINTNIQHKDTDVDNDTNKDEAISITTYIATTKAIATATEIATATATSKQKHTCTEKIMWDCTPIERQRGTNTSIYKYRKIHVCTCVM